jgi:hypothetical protein
MSTEPSASPSRVAFASAAGAQRDFGLAEADVAAHQPVHRPAGAEVVQHVGGRLQLVLGLGPGEFVDEGGIALRVGRQRVRRAGRALRCRPQQLVRDLADALLHPRLAL